MLRVITDEMIDDLLEQAAASDRKRMIYRLHGHNEPVQRMVNAVLPGTYVPPHVHGDPPKVELLAILRGKVAVLNFTPAGDLHQVQTLDMNGPIKIVDIPPGAYHCMIALQPSAVAEIVQGPYDPATHKQFPDWAPLEGAEGYQDYLARLEAQIT